MVIPEALKQRHLQYPHQSVSAGHPGSRGAYDTLLRFLEFPAMVVHIYKHMEQCPACAKNCRSERKHTSLMKLFPALQHFSGLKMDLFGPLITSKGGHKHILVIWDRFGKLTRAIPLRDATALTVASAFVNTWVFAYGIPDSVLMGNGPQFSSVYFQSVLGLLRILKLYLAIPPTDKRAGGTL